jgi:hypothetical protein
MGEFSSLTKLAVEIVQLRQPSLRHPWHPTIGATKLPCHRCHIRLLVSRVAARSHIVEPELVSPHLSCRCRIDILPPPCRRYHLRPSPDSRSHHHPPTTPRGRKLGGEVVSHELFLSLVSLARRHAYTISCSFQELQLNELVKHGFKILPLFLDISRIVFVKKIKKHMWRKYFTPGLP